MITEIIIALGSIPVLYFALRWVLFHGAIYHLKNQIGNLKFENDRLHYKVMKLQRERNKLAMDLIRLKNFKARLTALVKSTQRKKHDDSGT